MGSDDSGGRSIRAGRSEYRLELPARVEIDARQLILALGGEVPAPSMATPLTLAEFWPRFVSQYCRANRQKPRGVESKESHWRNHLEPMLGALPLEAIGAKEVQALKAKLGPRSAKTTNNVLSTLSKCLAVAVEWELLARAPLINPVPVAPPPFAFYDLGEYRLLCAAAAELGHSPHAAIRLGLDAGLRMGEVLALEWRDLDFALGLLSVERAESKGYVTSPKGGRGRVVPMTGELREALKVVPRGKCGRVLLRPDGSKLSEQNLRTWLTQAQRRAGLPAKGALHILRHTYCSHLAMAGAAPRTIQGLAGHASGRSTERYSHLAPTEKGRAVQALDRWRDMRDK